MLSTHMMRSEEMTEAGLVITYGSASSSSGPAASPRKPCRRSFSANLATSAVVVPPDSDVPAGLNMYAVYLSILVTEDGSHEEGFATAASILNKVFVIGHGRPALCIAACDSNASPYSDYS